MQKLITACFDLKRPGTNSHRKLRNAMHEQKWGLGLEGRWDKQQVTTKTDQGMYMGAPVTETTMIHIHDGPEEPVEAIAKRYAYDWQRTFEKLGLQGKVFILVSEMDGWAHTIIKRDMYEKIN